MNLPNRPSLFSSRAGLLFAFALTAREMAAESKVTYSHDIDAKWGYVGGAHIHEHGIAAGSIDEQNNSTLHPYLAGLPSYASTLRR